MSPLRRRLALALLPLLLAASACSAIPGLGGVDAEPVPPAEQTPPLTSGLDRFYDQRLTWRSCREGAECATMTVPLDYADPGGATLDLAVLRRPATDPDQRIGSLVVNPGGPGAGAQEYAAAAPQFFAEDLLTVFDVVGLDPRGVGESAPLDCLGDAALDTLLAFDPSPDTPAEEAEAERLARELARGCLQRTGERLGHVSTVETARDHDVLRAALGEERLTFFGSSYGTYLGALYAELFPARVGRMVLDGAIDPTLSRLETSLTQARGFQTALDAYLAACVEDGDCPLGEDVGEAEATVAGLLERLDERPLPVDGGRELTEGLALYGIFQPLYLSQLWPVLDQALESALRGDGETLLRLADLYVDRGPGGYRSNRIEAFFAISCLDQRGRRLSAEAEAEARRRFEEASPTFGRIFAAGLGSCADWPVRGVAPPAQLDASGAPPILVLGTSRDPATPLEWAEALADQLEPAVLVRRDGDGHLAYGSGNECIDDVVEAYLLRGTVPEGPVAC